MATGIYYPSNNIHDAHCFSTGFSFDDAWTGIGMGDISGSSRFVAIQFTSVSIPVGATITGAFIRFTAFSASTGTTVNLNLYFQNEDNSLVPTSGAILIAKSLTSAVAWNAVGSWTDGVQYDSPDMTGIMQDIVDRVGYAQGQNVCAQIRNNGSSANAKRPFSAHDYLSAAEKPELHVTWAGGWNDSGSFGSVPSANIGEINSILIGNINTINGI